MDELLSKFSDGKFDELSKVDKRKVAHYISQLSLKQLDKLVGSTYIKRYLYLVTFTIDPSKHPKLDDSKLLDIFKYISNQFQRPPLGVTKAQIVQEGNGKTKHYHFHVAVETSKYLKKDRFHYYIKKYGQIDISKSSHDSFNEILNYISKDSLPIVLI